MSDEVARAEVERVWGAGIPTTAGRDLNGILAAARCGALAGLVMGGVDPADLPDPALALQALDRVAFLVSLEVRAGAVTERADVVLPVAPVAEKAGRFVTWRVGAGNSTSPCTTPAACPTRGCCTPWPTRPTST